MERDPLKDLQDAIKVTHGCDSKYAMTVPVRETFGGQTWEGTVEVFDLIGHAKAKRCYAWCYRDGSETKAVAVLELPPVNCALSAVRVAAAGIRSC
jgi:hypothetical protein